MTASVESIILEELREFRKTTQAWMQETGERLATVETKMDVLAGGDQPGQVKELQDKVASLEKWRWSLAGGVSALTMAFGWLLKLYYK